MPSSGFSVMVALRSDVASLVVLPFRSMVTVWAVSQVPLSPPVKVRLDGGRWRWRWLRN